MPAAANPDFIFLGLTLKDILISGGWFLTIAGWFVSNYQTNLREIRKESWSEKDACIKLVSELVSKSRTYYGTLPTDKLSKSQAAEIQFELQRVIARLERLEKKHLKFEVTDVCGDLFQAITGDPFESLDRTVLNADSDVVINIEMHAHAVIDQLEEGFVVSFDQPSLFHTMKRPLNWWFGH
jgi:hypothetical protein